MHKNTNNHITAKLIVLGGFLKGKTSHIGHVRVEKYHVEHEENLSGSDGGVEIDSYFPIGKNIIKKRIIDDQFLHPAVELLRGYVERVVFLYCKLLLIRIFPHIQFWFDWLVHENTEETLLEILDLDLAFVAVAFVADDLLGEEDDNEEEVEVGLVVVYEIGLGTGGE